MKTMRVFLALAAMGLCAVSRAANPPASPVMVPEFVNYQGRLVQPNGLPYSNVNHSVELRLYETAGGGTAVWGETYTLRTQDGYFSVQLGSGGTALPGLTGTLWRVLWSQGPASSRTYFMGMTVKTDAQGNNLATPQEATPRQQFMTAPFALRAMQSTYAERAADEFQAPAGINTPQINSTSDVVVTKSLRITGSGNSLNTGRIIANDSSDIEILGKPGKQVEISADNNGLYLGTASPSGLPTYNSSFVQLGHYSSTGGSSTVVYGNTAGVYSRPGGTVTINNQDGQMNLGYTPPFGIIVPSYGPTNLIIGHPSTDVNIQTDNLKVNSQPLFKWDKFFYAGTGVSFVDTTVPGISATDYDMMVVGYSCTAPPTGVFVITGGKVRVMMPSSTNFSGFVWVMGIRKGMISGYDL